MKIMVVLLPFLAGCATASTYQPDGINAVKTPAEARAYMEKTIPPETLREWEKAELDECFCHKPCKRNTRERMK